MGVVSFITPKPRSAAASGGLLSFALMQKKVTKEKIKFGA
jgi:hypothetical protein